MVAIGLGTVQRAAKFKQDNELPYVVLADREQLGYQAYGLGKAGLSDIFKPDLILSGVRAFKAGARQGKGSGDPSQLPGTFIVDPAGMIQYAKPAKIASDLAATAELLSWIDHSR